MPSLVHSKISLKTMLRSLRKEEKGFWVECSSLETEQKGQDDKLFKNGDIPVGLRPTIQQYSKIFRSPLELSPSLGHEHSITLKAGSNPIGARPYRYPQS